MAVKFRARASDARVAIYTGADDVFTNPLADLSRVLFHSDLDYPHIISIHTGTVTLPAMSADTRRDAVTNLFAHGKAGTPMVFGLLTNLGGADIALQGSVPVAMNPYGFGRWVTLGANTTHVLMHEQSVAQVFASITPATGNGYAALTLNWKVYMTDTLL